MATVERPEAGSVSSRAPSPSSDLARDQLSDSKVHSGAREDALPPEPSAPQSAEAAALEKSLLRKLDYQIVPLCLMMYLLSFLDRTNIGQARLNGLEQSLNMSPDGRDYRIALTVLYVPYIIFEIPSNLLVKKVGPARWVPFLVMTWGLVSTLQGIVQSKTGLFINRAFLGLSEAGILPAIAIYMTWFYKPHELNLRQALYFSGASLSAAFGGLLATAISQMDGIAGLRGWQWIFILEGIFTCLFGASTFFLMPNDISKLWWLTSEERALAYQRMAPPPEVESEHVDGSIEKTADRDVTASTRVEAVLDTQEHVVTGRYIFSEVVRTFMDPLVLLFGAAGYAYSVLLYSTAFFSPTIIRAMDQYTVAESQLLTCPPAAAAFLVSIATAIGSDRFRWRYPFTVVCILLNIIGTAVAYAATDPTVRYGGIIILSCGGYSTPPIGISWLLNNAASHYKKATAIALFIVFTNSAGITSTWLFDNSEAPAFSRGFLVNLCLNCAALLLVTAAELYIIWETKQRKAGKRNWRVTELEKQGYSKATIKDILGDRHPEFQFTL